VDDEKRTYSLCSAPGADSAGVCGSAQTPLRTLCQVCTASRPGTTSRSGKLRPICDQSNIPGRGIPAYLVSRGLFVINQTLSHDGWLIRGCCCSQNIPGTKFPFGDEEFVLNIFDKKITERP
jgi:hypothetical protein